MLMTFVMSELVRKYGQRQIGMIPQMWWIQDGAPAHIGNLLTAKAQYRLD